MKIAFTKHQEPQRVYRPEELAHDLEGLNVTTWEGGYAEELLKKFFPVASMQTIDFVLEG